MQFVWALRILISKNRESIHQTSFSVMHRQSFETSFKAGNLKINKHLVYVVSRHASKPFPIKIIRLLQFLK